jgi:hypothetical protein
MIDPDFGDFARQPASQTRDRVTTGLALVSFVSGCLGFLFCLSPCLYFLTLPFGLGSVVAVVAGHWALSRMKWSADIRGGRLAMLGLRMGYGQILMAVVAIAFSIITSFIQNPPPFFERDPLPSPAQKLRRGSGSEGSTSTGGPVFRDLGESAGRK